jgi:hypothetical protein
MRETERHENYSQLEADARSGRRHSRPARAALPYIFGFGILLSAASPAAAPLPFCNQPFVPNQVVSSTVPSNGDLNPYGVAIVPAGFPSGGSIRAGDVLVSNFNNSQNLQGTGTTIVRLTPDGTIAPAGTASVFFQGSGLGLTTALGVLQRGFVLVGNVPTTDGTINTIKPGSLLFLDRNGNLVSPSPYTAQLDGPWDLTIDDRFDHARVFVSNVLNGTVTRLDVAVGASSVTVNKATMIASGYIVQPNDAALILGPTGLAYDAQSDVLYVASTADNTVFAVSQAGSRSSSSGRGATVFQNQHLRGPLALVFAPNGHLLTANGDAVNADVTQPSEIVEFTEGGVFVGEFNVDAAQGGAFGMAVSRAGGDPLGLFDRSAGLFAYVDDVTSSIIVLRRSLAPHP